MKAAAAGRLSCSVFTVVFGAYEQICGCTRLTNGHFIVSVCNVPSARHVEGRQEWRSLLPWVGGVALSRCRMCSLSIDGDAYSVVDRQEDTQLYGCN